MGLMLGVPQTGQDLGMHMDNRSSIRDALHPPGEGVGIQLERQAIRRDWSDRGCSPLTDSPHPTLRNDLERWPGEPRIILPLIHRIVTQEGALPPYIKARDSLVFPAWQSLLQCHYERFRTFGDIQGEVSERFLIRIW